MIYLPGSVDIPTRDRLAPLVGILVPSLRDRREVRIRVFLLLSYTYLPEMEKLNEGSN
jgi:hypothetical protein